MQYELNFSTKKYSFEGVPLQAITYQHPLNSSLTACQVTCECFDSERKRHFFHGFSINKDPEWALKVASCEVLERLLASRIAFDETYDLTPKFSIALVDGTTFREVATEEVLIREERGPKWARSSASGLAIHTNEQKAIQSAYLEIVERDLLCQIWYERKSLSILMEKSALKDDFTITRFTTRGDDIPFVLSVIESGSFPAFFSGSAVRGSLSEAQEKADMEALHLMTNIFVPTRNVNFGNTLDTSKRTQTLTGSYALSYISHFNSLVQASSRNPEIGRIFEFREILKNSSLDMNRFHHLTLRKFGNLYLCRAFHDDALTKNFSRHFYHGKCLQDPFC